MNWETKRLGDVTALVKGKKPKLFTKNGTKPYLTAKVIRGTEIAKMVDIKCPVSVWTKPEDIVIIMDGSNSGEMFTELDGALASTMGILRFDEKVLNPRYLLSFLVTHRENFTKSRTGAAIPHLNKEEFENLEIPVPSIDEQKHIVKILDEAFKKIDSAKESAEKNLQNSKELFESYLYNLFTNKDQGWEVKPWGDLCDFVRGPFGGSLKKSVFKADGYVVYEQKHAIHDHFNQLRYFIDEKKFNEMIRFELKPGDIIMSCSGVTLGRVAIVPEGIKRGIINQALLKLTPKKNVSVNFLKHWLRSKVFQDLIFEYSGGAAIPNVPSAKILKEILIPCPTLDVQIKTVKEIDGVQEKIIKLEANYTQKIADLNELKKSVLSKAFAGEL